MKRIFYALIALCAFMVVLPSCDNPNTPSNQGGNGQGGNGGGSSKEKEYEVKGVTFKMIEVKGGTFTMGALPNDEVFPDEEMPAHSVTVSDFFIGETEVTQELWEAVMGTNPSNFEGENLPVEYVSWDNCQVFIEMLNGLYEGQLGKKRFRLPTEAEWEYAARGGKKSEGYFYAGGNTLSIVGWYYENSGMTTNPVASLRPNELGIYDMSGNVCEWCSDIYGPYSEGEVTDPTGAETGDLIVNRGGGFKAVGGCRTAYRNYIGSTLRECDLGIRLVLVP